MFPLVVNLAYQQEVAGFHETFGTAAFVLLLACSAAPLALSAIAIRRTLR
jgi:hypothetical protein